jgi:putative peptide zinc metalloprotease protein
VTEAVSPPAAGPAGPGGAAAPSRADGVVLMGEVAGSGYRVPPALARRSDGQTVQLSPLLYATLDALDGRRSYADVADEVASVTGRPVNEDNARELVEKLRPMGLVLTEDGSQPQLPRSNPLLALRFKVAVSDPEQTNRLTAPFAALFHLAFVVPIVAAFCWISWWVLFEEGLASATHEAFAKPGLLLLVLAVTAFSAGFHEFGHAAGARRGGATPGVMGAGLYLVWPAFYTDVTDSYRLGRGGRVRTDLGGLYFNAIIAVATVGIWWATHYDALLLLVATQILQMLRQLLPLVRFDGYHVLADLTGVPDLFQRIGPTLTALVPWKETPPSAKALKPWARAVVTAWVLTVVPVLLVVLVLMVLTLPRIVGSAWAAAGQQQDLMAAAFGEGDVVAMLARALSMVIVVLPVAASAYLLQRLVRQVVGAVWRRTEGKPYRRALSGLTALAVLAGLVFAWWPSEERYRPVQAWEGGTLTQAVTSAVPQGGYAVGSQGAGTVMWPHDQPLPTRENPQLAAVLVPTGEPAGTDASEQEGTGDSAGTAPTQGEVSTADPGTWIFPFDQPLPPGEGDNQALAVNTTDDTAHYTVAFALVWADGEQSADNTNEAYAIASCESCAAVAVAFQVVLVAGETDVAVPTNVSVAVTYDCTSCLTFSLAVQLFVTLDGPLSDAAVADVEALWAQILEYGANIGQVPLDEIQAQLTAFEQQIIDIIEADQGPLSEPEESASPSPSESASPTTSTSGSTAPTTTPSGSPTASPSAPAPSPTASPSAPSASPSSSAGPTSSPSASPTASSSPSAAASSSP